MLDIINTLINLIPAIPQVFWFFPGDNFSDKVRLKPECGHVVNLIVTGGIGDRP